MDFIKCFIVRRLIQFSIEICLNFVLYLLMFFLSYKMLYNHDKIFCIVLAIDKMGFTWEFIQWCSEKE